MGTKFPTCDGAIGRKSIALAERTGSPSRRPPRVHPGRPETYRCLNNSYLRDTVGIAASRGLPRHAAA